ncbi:MAG TPA: PHB depolymerase family esterase [Polyangiaceae bacterium]|nr:PHB depolymerase family esterase [Polyangiaceae bacterium]
MLTEAAGAGAVGGSAAEGSSGTGTISGGGTTAGGSASAGQGGSVAGSAAGHASGGTSGGSGGTSGEGGAAGTGGGSQSCVGRASLTAGDSKSTLQHGGRARSYLLHVPSGLAAGTALAVVIDLHGASGNGSQQKGMSGFSALSDKKKFLAVFPDGVDGYWNVDDTCCGTAGKEKVDDVGFLKAIISKLKTDTCIDSKRVYVSGFSNGGGLTHRMGCDAADVIAAIAPMATDLRTVPCKPARAISMLEIRGLSDSLEPYAGGLVGPAGGQYTAVGAKASLKLWADINSCTGSASSFEQYCERYTQCGSSVETALCSLPNVDHSPYGNSLNFDVASIAWSLFERQPMK